MAIGDFTIETSILPLENDGKNSVYVNGYTWGSAFIGDL